MLCHTECKACYLFSVLSVYLPLYHSSSFYFFQSLSNNTSAFLCFFCHFLFSLFDQFDPFCTLHGACWETAGQSKTEKCLRAVLELFLSHLLCGPLWCAFLHQSQDAVDMRRSLAPISYLGHVGESCNFLKRSGMYSTRQKVIDEKKGLT